MLHTYTWYSWTSIFVLQVAMASVVYRKDAPDLTVLENTTIGTAVLDDIRSHFGLPPNSMVKLGPGSLNQFFRLNAESGQLISTESLDLESPALCKVEKSCCRVDTLSLDSHLTSNPSRQHTDMSSSSSSNKLYQQQTLSDGTLSGHSCSLMAFVLANVVLESQLSPVTKLQVIIVDLNDNPPIFHPDSSSSLKKLPVASDNSATVQVSFLEGTAGLNSKQDLILADDADFSPFNRVRKYWLEWSTTNSDGTPLVLEDPIRRSSSVRMNEPNGLTWALLSPFRLTYLETSRTLALEVDSELDREKRQMYHMRLIAEDNGGLRGELRIAIEVVDVNEYAPVFIDVFSVNAEPAQWNEPGVYQKHFNVKESLPVGTEIGRLRAEDKDHAKDNVITYRLGPCNPQAEVAKTFNLDATSGALTLMSTLDFETTRHYRLTVIAQDGPQIRKDVLNNVKSTSVRRSSTGIIEITINDVNDNAPVIRFEKDATKKQTTDINSPQIAGTPVPHEVWIKENIPKRSPVIFFSVFDLDLDENGRVTCDLMNWTDRFRLREFSGLYGLETLSLFDRETTDIYHVSIRCQDQGIPVLHTDQLLIIYVEDINDLPPTFPLSVYQFHVLENSPTGTPLLPINTDYPSAVTATDPDLNNTLVYRLEPGEAGSLAGSRPVGTSQTRHTSNAMDHHMFEIDPIKGIIVTQGELDREQQARLIFSVCADDGKHSTCVKVIVTLDDVDDNRPLFDRDTYVIRVEENWLSSEPLLKFAVTDADADNHGFIFEFVHTDVTGRSSNSLTEATFPIESVNHTVSRLGPRIPIQGTVSYHFTLRENTLYLRRPLDRELRSSYHFFIRVTDSHDFTRLRESMQIRSGQSEDVRGLSSEAEIFVDVGDTNDNAPMLTFPNSTGPAGNQLVVSCHERMGSSVGRLQATDTDLGQNASISFSLIHTPEVDQLFYLDSQSGELFVNTGQLSDKCGKSAIMVVSADDQGPKESKKARTAPIERLLIKLEDKPTLAELIAAETPHKLRALSGSDTAGASADNNGAVSTRTVLSVILGASTVFLICLLIVWMVLLLYSRSRRRKRQIRIQRKHLQHQPQPPHRQGGVDVKTPVEHLVLGAAGFECATLAGDNEKYGEGGWMARPKHQGIRVPVAVTDTVNLDQTGIPLDLDRNKYAADSDTAFTSRPSTMQRDSRMGQCDLYLTASPTLTTRLSPTRSTDPSERPSMDYVSTTLWPCDPDSYHTLQTFDRGRSGGAEGVWSKRGVNRLSGPPAMTVSNAKCPSTLGRLFPKWFMNNILPRTQTKDSMQQRNTIPLKDSSSTARIYPNDHHQQQQLQHQFSPNQDSERSTPHEASSTSHYTTQPQHYVVYATLRRVNAQPITLVPTTLNNQNTTDVSNTTCPFLTPPAPKRQLRCKSIPIDDESNFVNTDEYTQLRKDVQCQQADPSVKPTPSILSTIRPSTNMSNILSPPCTGTETSTDPTGIPYSQRDLAFPPQLCPGEIVYSCCCPTCDLTLHHSSWTGTTTTNNPYGSLSPEASGSDSTRTCPQCHMLDMPLQFNSQAHLHQGSCCENPYIKRSSMTLPNNSASQTAVSNGVEGSTHCPVNCPSAQDVLNSCV